MLDSSLNTSVKNMYCNHCMLECQTYEKMKEHYKSDFHKYNLNRVTMNLNPLTYADYIKKKEMYLSKVTSAQTKQVAQESRTFTCEICRKTFSSSNKYNEHLSSKSHKKTEEEIKSQPVKPKVEKEEEKTTLEDLCVCLFCNKKLPDMEKNFLHMVDAHRLDIPFVYCIRNYKGLLKLLAKKIFTYNACLTCDSQNFKNHKSLQNHMVDKQHTYINMDDLDEFLYKFYDQAKILGIKEKELRMTKEFKLLKFKFKLKKKTNTKVEEEEWEVISEEEASEQPRDANKTKPSLLEDEEDDDEDFETIKLPNGELLLEDGTILGNKIYKIFYKQRIHVRKYESLVNSIKKQRKHKPIVMKKVNTLPKTKYFSLSGSNKGCFKRINTLFKARAQVDV